MKRTGLLFALLLLSGPASAQPEVEELLDEVRAMARGYGLGSADPADLERIVESELPAVELAAGMRRIAPVATRIVTREEAHAHVAALVAEQLPPQKLAAIEVAWRGLGLLDEGVALGPAIEALYAGQAGGFYDSRTKSMVLLGDVPMMLQVPVVRHELVHALQDQTWDLTKWLGDAGEDEDRAAAVQAVLEGHATDVMNRVTLGSFGVGGAMSDEQTAELSELMGGDLQGISGLEDLLGSALDATTLGAFLPRDAPPVLRAQLLFPYVLGATFVSGYRAAHPEDPGCEALYRRPPQSTAEVLDPRLWESGTFTPDYSTSGIRVPGFDVTWTSALGRLISWILLTGQVDANAGDPFAGRWDPPSRDRAVVLGSGWRGDRVAVLRPKANPPGTDVPAGHVVAWASRWRDAQEAQSVRAALQKRLPAAHIAAEGDRVHVVVGARGAVKERVLAALAGWK
jgi:hypothetical protein